MEDDHEEEDDNEAALLAGALNRGPTGATSYINHRFDRSYVL